MMIGLVTGEGEGEEEEEGGKSHCKVGTRWVRQTWGCLSVSADTKYEIVRTHFVSCFSNPVAMELEVTTLYPSPSRPFKICNNNKLDSVKLYSVYRNIWMVYGQTGALQTMVCCYISTATLKSGTIKWY